MNSRKKQQHTLYKRLDKTKADLRTIYLLSNKLTKTSERTKHSDFYWRTVKQGRISTILHTSAFTVCMCVIILLKFKATMAVQSSDSNTNNENQELECDDFDKRSHLLIDSIVFGRILSTFFFLFLCKNLILIKLIFFSLHRLHTKFAPVEKGNGNEKRGFEVNRTECDSFFWCVYKKRRT